MTASTNMFHKMHLIRSASGRHDSKIFAAPAARASPGITPSHSPSVVDPRALREPPAAPPSGCPWGHPTCLESRYQAFIASRNRIQCFCQELDFVLTVYATTIIIAFETHDALNPIRCVCRYPVGWNGNPGPRRQPRGLERR